MTPALKTAAPGAEVRDLLAGRMHAGLVLILTFNLAFMAVDFLLQRGEALLVLVPIKLVQIVAVGIAFVLMRREPGFEAMKRIAVATIAVIAFTPCASGIVRGDIAPTAVLLLALAMGTASLLPLGTRVQTVITALSGASILLNTIVVAGLGATFGYEPLGIAAALVATIFVAREHERTRRDRARVAALLDGQTQVLEMVATGRPLADVLQALTLLIEHRAEGLRCSVLLLDGDTLRSGAAPSFPACYSEAVDGLVIGPDAACCGRAAYTRAPVVVTDTSADPLWAAFRPLALEHDIRACWSAPILATDGRCLGTFAMYYREVRAPGRDEWHLLDTATHIAGVAIARARTEEALTSVRTAAEAEAARNAQLVEELTRAGEVKSQFVSTMSHELRTPLSVILGYTDVLRDELQADEQCRTLDRIRHSGMELLDLIESTLDLGRLEAGRDAPECAAVAVRPMLGELEAEFDAVHTNAATTLRFESTNGVALWTDQRKLKIILKNLVGNALKFTPRGSVAVSCAEEAAGCVFRVHDTGVGIAREYLPHIFEMFRQGDGSDRRLHGGVGLGLYITRRLVTQLGGDIAVDSTPGEGTLFVVTLPGGGAARLDA